MIANKGRLFIIRLTESQLSLCGCQWEGQTETAKERDRGRKGAFSILRKVFLPCLTGNGHQVAGTALGLLSVFAVTYPEPCNRSNSRLQRMSWKVPSADCISEILFVSELRPSDEDRGA